MVAEIWKYRYPPGEKAPLQYLAIRYLPFANLPMEELIKVHARHLADVEDFIWDSKDREFSCHLGIRSIYQVEALGLPITSMQISGAGLVADSAHYDTDLRFLNGV